MTVDFFCGASLCLHEVKDQVENAINVPLTSRLRVVATLNTS